MNFYVLYAWELKTRKKIRPSICLSVYLSLLRTYVRTSVNIITFEGVSGSKQILVGVFYYMYVLVLKYLKYNPDPDSDPDQILTKSKNWLKLID